jgi:hypothetical protein
MSSALRGADRRGSLLRLPVGEIAIAAHDFENGKLAWFKYEESLGDERPKVAASSLARLAKDDCTFVVPGSKSEKVGSGASLLRQVEETFKNNIEKQAAAPFESAKPPHKCIGDGLRETPPEGAVRAQLLDRDHRSQHERQVAAPRVPAPSCTCALTRAC